MKLFIIRHGESTWNSKGIIQGSSNPHLSPNGRKQARELAGYLKTCRIDRLFTSHLARAYQTAQIVSRSIKKNIIKAPQLQEIGLGMWEGLRVKNFTPRQEKIYKAWFKSPSKTTVPGAEKIDAFRTRIAGAFNDIIHSADGAEHIAVVTHGGAICAYLSVILKADIDKMLVAVRFDNAGLTVVEVFDKKFFWVRVVNSTAHLKTEGNSRSIKPL